MQPRETAQTIFRFLRHPVAEIGHLPNWSPKKTIIVQAICAAISGVLTGLLPFGLWKLLQGMILFPITFSILMGLLTCFFYYYFQIFEQRTLSFFEIFKFLFFVHLPYFIFHVGSAIFPVADVAGLAICAMIMMVGLQANFNVQKKRAVQLVAAVFGALLVVWLAERVSHFSQENLASVAAITAQKV